MSVKRQATTQLNHDNWDQDDPSEHEEMGSFKSASQDVLEKRVIRTAKRRSTASSGEPKPGVFSGFGGFNKAQPSSFDFLANLTNVNKNANGSPSKSDTFVTTTSLFSKPTATSPSGGLFSSQSSTTPPKLGFGMPSAVSPISGGTAATSSGFTASKADSTVGDSPFKIQPVVSSSADTSHSDFTKTTNANSSASTSQVTSTIFGIPPSTTNKPLFSTTINSSPFKIPSVSTTTTSIAQSSVTTLSMSKPANTKSSDNKQEEKSDEKKMKYYTKLRGLNQSVSNWIKKHVEDTPVCILSPIFKDYEKHLKDIQDEYQGTNNAGLNNKAEGKAMVSPFGAPPTENKTSTETTNKPSLFGIPNNAPAAENKPTFSFGIKPPPATTSATSTGTGFSFGTTAPSQPMAPSAQSTFSFAANTATTNTNGATPFSFGTSKPFSFNSNVQTAAATDAKPSTENEEEDVPPKVEFTPIVEENSVFEKRCKIFVKKDGNFVDKGVGTLYLKKIEETGKHQLLVRANTSLGNILLNLILVSAIPTQRTGKNNVMMVCIPTPESKPPPTPVLIRVKTSEEADELLETLNKYKT